jgi:hypothetical protein
LFGIGLISVATWSSWSPEAIIKGIVVGLVSSGLYSSTKKTILNK